MLEFYYSFPHQQILHFKSEAQNIFSRSEQGACQIVDVSDKVIKWIEEGTELSVGTSTGFQGEAFSELS